MDTGRAVEAEIRQMEAARERYYKMLESTEPGSDEEATAMERVVELKRRIQAAKEGLGTAAKVVPLPAAVTMEQVRAFTDGLRARLSDDPLEFQAVVALMRRDHGLQVEVLDGHRVRVSLAIDAGGIGGGTRLVATAAPRVSVSGVGGEPHVAPGEWLATARAANPRCACGCGEAIEVEARHRWLGVPAFRVGHHFKVKVAAPGAEDGWMLMTEAVQVLGLGETTIRRWADQGKLECRWVVVKGKRVRVVRGAEATGIVGG